MFVTRHSIQSLNPTGVHFARMCSQLGELGSGAGRGGGGGGSIRAAGGSFGKMEVAHEEQYFYNKQKLQLERLKNDQINQVEFHHQQIKEHEQAIQRHKTYLENIGRK